MKRKLRTEILIKSDITLAKCLAESIQEKYQVVIVEKPNAGLVMVKMRETAKKHLFFLGETYVTECKVQINENIGLGIVSGNEPELAYYLAVIDATYNANLIETELFNQKLKKSLQVLEHRGKEENQRILKTKVNFETMQEELIQ